MSIIETAKSLIVKMDPQVRDAVYRLLWSEYVKEAIKSQINEDDRFDDIDDESIEALAERCSDRYCIEGDYDCNLEYWTNIQNLIDDDLSSYIKENPTELTRKE